MDITGRCVPIVIRYLFANGSTVRITTFDEKLARTVAREYATSLHTEVRSSAVIG